MKHRAGQIFCGIGLVVLLLQDARAASQRAEALFTTYNARTFAALPEAKAPIVFDEIDLPLLSAAVFHETNRRRARQNLPALRFDAEVRRAATLQAQIMARTGEISHENPDIPEHATLELRLASFGLKPRFAAENLAYTFAVHYKSGQRLYVREENGQKIFSASPGGPPVPAHSYASFAKAVVEQWMNSEGHRRNLLNRDPRFWE